MLDIPAYLPFLRGAYVNPRLIPLAGVIRPDGNITPGGAITWSFLPPSTNHSFSGFTGKIVANGNNLEVFFPKCKNVISFHVTPDETLAGRHIFCGASVATDRAIIQCHLNTGVYGGYLVGSGSTFTKNADLSLFNFGTLSSSAIYFNPPKPFSLTVSDTPIASTFWKSCIVNYVGSNDRILKRKLSGLGSNYFGYDLLDNTGTPVVTNDSDDIIEIISNTPRSAYLNMNSNNGLRSPGEEIFTVNSNLWLSGVVEV